MLFSICNVALRGLTLLGKFMLLLALAKYISPDDFGKFGLMLSMVAMALPFMGLEFNYFMNREMVTAFPVQRVAAIRDALCLYAVLYLVTLSCVFLISQFGLFPKEILFPFVFLAVLEHLSNEATRLLITLSRPIKGNLVLFFRSAAWGYVVVAYLWLSPGSVGLTEVFLGWSVGLAISLLLAIWFLRDLPWRKGLKKRPDYVWVKNGILISRPFLVSMLAGAMFMYIDRLFINHSLGLEAVGIYTFLSGLAIAVHTLVNTGIQLVKIPILVHAHEHNHADNFRMEVISLSKQTIIAIVVLAFAAIVLIHPVLILVKNEEYLNSVHVFYILLLAVFFRCMSDIPIAILYAVRYDLSIMSINVGAFIVVLLGNMALTPKYGMEGAAISAVMGAVFQLFMGGLFAFHLIPRMPIMK